MLEADRGDDTVDGGLVFGEAAGLCRLPPAFCVAGGERDVLPVGGRVLRAGAGMGVFSGILLLQQF